LQLSRTLDHMCVALNSYFSVKEDARIAKAIRQQTLPSRMRQPPSFEFKVRSVANDEHCGETYDSVDDWRSLYSHAKELLGKKPERTAYPLLDTSDKGVDSLDTVKYMNNYMQADRSLPGPIWARNHR
jgi:hypothetical protein